MIIKLNLKTDMVNPTQRLGFEEASNGAVLSKRVEKLQLGVFQLNKNGGDTMLRQILEGEGEEKFF